METDPTRERIARYFRIALAAYGVLVVLAMYPHTPDPTGDIKRLLLGWAAGILVLWWVVASWWYRWAWRRPAIFVESLAAFLALYAVATMRSEFRGVGSAETAYFAALFGLYFIAAQVYTAPAQVRRLMAVVCCAMLAASLYGFVQHFGLDIFPWDDRSTDVYKNLPATFGNPNFAAHMLVLTIPMAVYLLIEALLRKHEDAPLSAFKRFRGLAFWAVAIAAFLAHLRFTGQRAGLIALAAALLLVLTARVIGRRFKRPMAGAVVSLALVAGLALGGAGGAMLVSKMRTGTTIPLDTSLLIRYQSYVSGSDMLFQRPLLGYGPGVYAIEYPRFWTTFEKEWFAQETRVNAHVHNDLIEIAIDAGIPAAGLYFLVLLLGMGYGLLMAFSASDPARRRMGYLFAGLFLGFLVDGLFGFNLRVPVSASMLFLLMGTLDGVCSPVAEARRPGRWTWAGRIALTAAMAAVVVIDSRVFAAQYDMQQGIRAQMRKDYGEARDCFTRGLRMTPWDWQFDRRMGLVCMAEQKLDEAVGYLTKSIALNPEYVMTRIPMAHCQMILAQRQMRDHPDQVEAALKTLAEGTNQLNALLDVCPMFPSANELMGRIASISAVYASTLKTPEAAERANAFWKDAQTHLKLALRYELKNQSEIYRMLAKVRMALGDDTGAEQALCHAVQVAPTDMDTWPIFLEFANGHKRYDSARNALYAQISRLKEADKPDRNALGTAHLYLANILENGYPADLDAIDKAFQNAADNVPQRPEVWTNLARYAHDRERTGLLEASVAQSCAKLSLDKQKPLPWVAAVNGVLQNGAPELERATTVLMSHVRAHKAGEPMSAVQEYGWAARELLDLAGRETPETPGVCPSYMNLGIVFAGFDDLKTAEQLFAKAKECLDPPRQSFLAIHWADVMLRGDRPMEALTLLRDARDKYPDNLDCRWAYARTLVKMKMFPEAREEYESLLKLPDLAAEGRAMLEKELASLQGK